jgi:hypothetical protein
MERKGKRERKVKMERMVNRERARRKRIRELPHLKHQVHPKPVRKTPSPPSGHGR